MASNKRIFDDVQGLVANAVNVGGATSVAVTMDHVHKVDSREDSVQGTSVVSDAGQRVDVDIRTTDIMQLVPVLTSTPGALNCKARESGAATFGLLEVAQATQGVLVMHSGNFSCSRDRYAAVGLRGTVRFLTGKTIADVVKYTAAQTAPTITQPSRLWQPTAMAHNGTSNLPLLHAQEASFDINGRVLTDYGDDDVGMTAVDVADYDAITGTITIRDASATTGQQIAQQLVGNGVGNLTITLSGVGEIASKVLTLRNVKFRSYERTGGKDYTAWRVPFAAQWRDPATPFTIRTLTDATAANRMINFA